MLTPELSSRIFKVPEVEAMPRLLVAVHLYMPASLARQSRISRRTRPKSVEGRNLVPLGKGFPFTCQSMDSSLSSYRKTGRLTYLHGGVLCWLHPCLKYNCTLLSHLKVIEVLSEGWIPKNGSSFLLRIDAWSFQVSDLVKCSGVQRGALEAATNWTHRGHIIQSCLGAHLHTAWMIGSFVKF